LQEGIVDDPSIGLKCRCFARWYVGGYSLAIDKPGHVSRGGPIADERELLGGREIARPTSAGFSARYSALPARAPATRAGIADSPDL